MRTGIALLDRLVGDDRRTMKAIKNIVGMFLLKGLNAMIGFIMVPIAFHYLDQSLYGVWLTMSGIFTWISFFDIGMGHGLRNKLTEAIAKGDYGTARGLVSTAYLVIAGIFISLFAIFYFLNPYLSWEVILNVGENEGTNFSILARILFLFFCIRFIFQLITSISYGMQEPIYAQMIEISGRVLSLMGIYLVTIFSDGNLLYLGVVLSISPVISMLVYSIILFRNRYKEIRPAFKYVDRKYFNAITSLGFKFFFIQICFIVIYQSNNLIIAQLFGPEEVATYNIILQYFSVATMFLTIVITPFWSAVTDAYTKGEFAWLKRSFFRLSLLWLGVAVLVGILFTLSGWLIPIWMRHEVTLPAGMVIAIAVYTVINGYNSLLVQYINGMGKVTIQFFYGIMVACIHVPATLWFCQEFGIQGIMFSSIIAGLFAILIYLFQCKMLFNNSAHGLWNK